MFIKALTFLAFAASASASLAGLTVSDSAFTIASVNPTTGASVATQKTLVTRPGGTIALHNVRGNDADTFWSLQSQSDMSGTASAHLVKQDIRFGGRREECALSGTVKPIHIFGNGSQDSVTSIAVSPTGFGIYTVTINPKNRICTTTLLAQLPSMASVSATAAAMSGDNLFFITEDSTGFTATAGAQLRVYTITSSAATVATNAATISLGSAFVSSIVATSSTNVQAIGFDKADSKFKVWSIDTATATVSTTTRSISETNAAGSVEISTSSAYVAKSNSIHIAKFIRGTTSSTSNIGTIDLSSTTAAEATAANALGSMVFNLFNLNEVAFTAMDVDANLPNGVRITGPNLYSATTEVTTLSRCRFTVGAADPVVVSAFASTTLEGVVCRFQSATNGLAATVKVEFAADGVNYGPASSFSYGGSSASSVKFDRTSYALDDGTAFSSNRRPVQAEFFDADGNKMLFTSAITATLSASSSQASIRSIAGTSATSSSGRVTFPNFAIDTYSTNQANGVTSFQLQVSSGSATNAASATIRHRSKTFGTLAALSLASSKFSLSLVNPSAATVALGDRTVTTTNAISLGLNTYDADNLVYNTIEGTSTGTQVLIGQAVRTGVNSQGGVGECTMPNTVNVRDTPVQIAYEKTNANGSVDFLALVVLAGVDGTNFKIIRINRLASSAVTTMCTVTVIDQLPQSELSYAHGAFLNNGRVAIIERDTVFATSQNAILSVWTMTTTDVAGSWQIRNKAIPFSVVGVSQSGDNELAISGSSTSAGTVTSGVWRVDLTDDANAILAPTNGFTTFTTNDEQAYFLAAGSVDAPIDNRFHTAVTSSSTGVRRIESVSLSSGSATAAATKSSVTTDNMIDLFPINDPVVNTVTPSSVTGTATIVVKASNVIKSSSLKCRFSTSGLASVDVTVDAALSTVTFPADNSDTSCGAIPPNYLGSDRAVFVELSNDGGANFGPASCIAVNNGACPSIAGIAANPSTAPSTSGSSTIPVNRQIVFFFAGKTANDCAASVATINAFLTAAGVQFTTVTEADCVFNANYISTAITTSAVRMLQGTSGVVISSVLNSAADKNTAVAFGQTAAGQTALGGATLNDANPAVAASDDDDGLTDGEIAGIVIGSIAGVVLIGALIAFALKGSSKKAPAAAASPAATYSTRDATFTDATTASGSYDSTGASGSYDSTSGSYDSDSGSYDSEDYSDYSGSSYV